MPVLFMQRLLIEEFGTMQPSPLRSLTCNQRRVHDVHRYQLHRVVCGHQQLKEDSKQYHGLHG